MSACQSPSIMEYGKVLSPRQNGCTNTYEDRPFGLRSGWGLGGGPEGIRSCSARGSRVDYLVSVLLALPGGGERPSGEGGSRRGTLTGKKGEEATKLSPPSYFDTVNVL